MNNSSLSIDQIKAIVPQRYPMLMLDKIESVDPGVKVVAIKSLSGNEIFYQGHFPGYPITPGAMIAEAIAQTGIIFFYFATERTPSKKVVYLIGNIQMRFLEPILPGEQMRIEVEAKKITKTAGLFTAKVLVCGKIAVKGQFGLSMKEK